MNKLNETINKQNEQIYNQNEKIYVLEKSYEILKKRFDKLEYYIKQNKYHICIRYLNISYLLQNSDLINNTTKLGLKKMCPTTVLYSGKKNNRNNDSHHIINVPYYLEGEYNDDKDPDINRKTIEIYLSLIELQNGNDNTEQLREDFKKRYGQNFILDIIKYFEKLIIYDSKNKNYNINGEIIDVKDLNEIYILP